MMCSHTLWIYHLPPFSHSRHSKDNCLLVISPADQLILVSGTLHAVHLARKILPPDLGIDGSFSLFQVFAHKSFQKVFQHPCLPPSPTLLSDFLLYYIILLLCGIYHEGYCVTFYGLMFVKLFILSPSTKNVNATRVPCLSCSLQYTHSQKGR